MPIHVYRCKGDHVVVGGSSSDLILDLKHSVVMAKCRYSLVFPSCGEVELVRQVHTLVVRSAQVKVVYEIQVQEEVEGVRQEVREVKGESKVEESRSLHERTWMRWMTNTRLTT